MGIRNLWDAVKPAGMHSSLHRLMLEETIKQRDLGRSGNPSVMGVDLQIMLSECIAATRAAGIHTHLEGGALQIFFNKVCILRKGAGSAVFVDDGDERPSVKRGTYVKPKDTWMIKYVIEILDYIGYYYYKAPGEAEAELSRLNREGIIHGILSTDSDNFPFGGNRIYRMLPKANRTNDDEVILYTSQNIQQNSDIGLSRGGLVLFALLVGGDYHPGVEGCGRKVATELARCGFGDELVAAVESKTLDTFLHDFPARIKSELRFNQKGRLETKHTHLANIFPDHFPERWILDLYTSPITSWSEGHLRPRHLEWTHREPMIARIAGFCSDHFGWQTEDELKRRLHTHLWEPVLAQMIYSPFLLYSPKTKLLATPNTNAVVMSASRMRRTGKLIPQGTSAPRITVSVANFVELIRRGFSANDNSDLTIWVPEEFLPHGMIPKAKEERKSKKRKRAIPKRKVVAATSDSAKTKGKGKERDLPDIDLDDIGQPSAVIPSSRRRPYAYTGDQMEGPSSLPTEVIEVEYTESDEDMLREIEQKKKARISPVVLNFPTPSPFHFLSPFTPVVSNNHNDNEEIPTNHIATTEEPPQELTHMGILDLTDTNPTPPDASSNNHTNYEGLGTSTSPITLKDEQRELVNLGYLDLTEDD